MKARRKEKRIHVKVEDMETGRIVKSFDCGANERRAEKLQDALLARTDLEKYHVSLTRVERYNCEIISETETTTKGKV